MATVTDKPPTYLIVSGGSSIDDELNVPDHDRNIFAPIISDPSALNRVGREQRCTAMVNRLH